MNLAIFAICGTLVYLATFGGLCYVVIQLSRRNQAMAVIAAFQPAIDSLNASAAAITAKAGELPAGAASAQDVTDTSTAVDAAAKAVADALNPPAPEPAPAPAP